MLISKEDELKTVKEQCQRRDAIAEEAQQTILSLQNSIKENQSQLTIKDDEVKRLQRELEARSESLAIVQKSLEASKVEHEVLRGQATEISRDKETLVQQLKENISHLEKKLSSSEEQVQSQCYCMDLCCVNINVYRTTEHCYTVPVIDW